MFLRNFYTAKISRLLALVVLPLLVLLQSVEARSTIGCESVLASKKGTLRNGTPYQLKLTPKVETLNIKLIKVSGKASATVYLYQDGQRKELFRFSAASINTQQVAVLNKVRNKSCTIEIVSEEPKGKFVYQLIVTGWSTKLGTAQMDLQSLAQKTFYTRTACDDKVKLALQRQSGKATATVYVYRGNIKVWESFWKADEKYMSKTFSSSTDKKYKVVVKNVSADERLKVKLAATQL